MQLWTNLSFKRLLSFSNERKKNVCWWTMIMNCGVSNHQTEKFGHTYYTRTYDTHTHTLVHWNTCKLRQLSLLVQYINVSCIFCLFPSSCVDKLFFSYIPSILIAVQNNNHQSISDLIPFFIMCLIFDHCRFWLYYIISLTNNEFNRNLYVTMNSNVIYNVPNLNGPQIKDNRKKVSYMSSRKTNFKLFLLCFFCFYRMNTNNIKI